MTRDELAPFAAHLQADLNQAGVPFFSSYISTLGGTSRASLMIAISTDFDGSGIFENSSYAKFALHTDGQDATLEVLSYNKVSRLRKKSFKLDSNQSWRQVADYLRKWFKSQ